MAECSHIDDLLRQWGETCSLCNFPPAANDGCSLCCLRNAVVYSHLAECEACRGFAEVGQDLRGLFVYLAVSGDSNFLAYIQEEYRTSGLACPAKLALGWQQQEATRQQDQ